MEAIGAGVAVLGAWVFSGLMLTARYSKGLDGNRGWAAVGIICAVLGTALLIDAL